MKKKNFLKNADSDYFKEEQDYSKKLRKLNIKKGKGPKEEEEDSFSDEDLDNFNNY